MASPLQYPCILFAALLVLGSTGTVTLSNGTGVTVSGPLTKSLSSSYTLSNGHTWNRDRPNTPDLFAETFTHSILSTCTIKCGPYSWPVISSGLLFCERDLSYFAKNQPYSGNSYKALCIPDVSNQGAACNAVTYGLAQNSLVGSCNYDTVANSPLYSSNAAFFDCCHNNNNFV